jgi:hypothetical protein
MLDESADMALLLAMTVSPKLGAFRILVVRRYPEAIRPAARLLDNTGAAA